MTATVARNPSQKCLMVYLLWGTLSGNSQHENRAAATTWTGLNRHFSSETWLEVCFPQKTPETTISPKEHDSMTFFSTQTWVKGIFPQTRDSKAFFLKTLTQSFTQQNRDSWFFLKKRDSEMFFFPHLLPLFFFCTITLLASCYFLEIKILSHKDVLLILFSFLSTVFTTPFTRLLFFLDIIILSQSMWIPHPSLTSCSPTSSVLFIYPRDLPALSTLTSLNFSILHISWSPFFHFLLFVSPL